MIIELSVLKEKTLKTTKTRTIGKVDNFLIDGERCSLAGFQILKTGVIKKFFYLPFEEVISLSREQIIVDSEQVLVNDLKISDKQFKRVGPVLGVKATTESGKNLGKVSDVMIEADTGLIIRFVLRNFVSERIIPRQFIVTITPKHIVFKDIVDTPIFNQLASAPAV